MIHQPLILVVLVILLIAFLLFHVLRGFPLWPSFLVLVLIVLLGLTGCVGGGLRQDGRVTETYQRWDIPSLFSKTGAEPDFKTTR